MRRISLYNIDGKYCRKDRAVVPVQDTVVMRGYGAFDSLRTYRGVPYHLEAHLSRFLKTVRLLKIQLGCTKNQLASRVVETLRVNGFKESLIRIYATGGLMGNLIPVGKPSLIIAVDPLHAFPKENYEKGVALATTKLCRVLALAKSTSYLSAVVSTIEARGRGFDDILFLNEKGEILEGSTFNIAAVIGSTVIAPEEGVLEGVTMRETLKIAARLGFSIKRRPITPSDVKKAAEIFITSSNRELIPVRKIDRVSVDRRRGWPVTWALHREYVRRALAEVARRRQG